MDAVPPVRQEGDVTIISIVEERAVVTKQLFVVEEVVVRARENGKGPRHVIWFATAA